MDKMSYLYCILSCSNYTDSDNPRLAFSNEIYLAKMEELNLMWRNHAETTAPLEPRPGQESPPPPPPAGSGWWRRWQHWAGRVRSGQLIFAWIPFPAERSSLSRVVMEEELLARTGEVADCRYLETTNSPDLLQFLIFFTPPRQPSLLTLISASVTGDYWTCGARLPQALYQTVFLS